jgi:hypothetical protein
MNRQQPPTDRRIILGYGSDGRAKWTVDYGTCIVMFAAAVFVAVLILTFRIRGCDIWGHISRQDPGIAVPTVRQHFTWFASAIDAFMTNTGRMPTEDEGLEMLLTTTNPVTGRHYLTFFSDDPWGHPYVYRVKGLGYEIVSLGPDGKVSNDDMVYSSRASWGQAPPTVPNGGLETPHDPRD